MRPNPRRKGNCGQSICSLASFDLTTTMMTLIASQGQVLDLSLSHSLTIVVGAEQISLAARPALGLLNWLKLLPGPDMKELARSLAR